MDQKKLEQLPKSSYAKLVLAWWLRENTKVALRWMAERLGMVHAPRAARAISRVSRHHGRKLDKMERRLLQLTGSNQPE